MTTEKEVQEFKDLLRLIEKCRANGVKLIKYKGIEVVFGGETIPLPQTLTTRQTKAVVANTKQIEDEAIQDASRELDDEEMATLSVEDPARYEQLLAERELEDERKPVSEEQQ